MRPIEAVEEVAPYGVTQSDQEAVHSYTAFRRPLPSHCALRGTGLGAMVTSQPGGVAEEVDAVDVEEDVCLSEMMAGVRSDVVPCEVVGHQLQVLSAEGVDYEEGGGVLLTKGCTVVGDPQGTTGAHMTKTGSLTTS